MPGVPGAPLSFQCTWQILPLSWWTGTPHTCTLHEDRSPIRLSHSSCGVQGVLQANTARKPCATFVVPSLPALQTPHCQRRSLLLLVRGPDVDLALLMDDPRLCTGRAIVYTS
jgi:hypothetical protein